MALTATAIVVFALRTMKAWDPTIASRHGALLHQRARSLQPNRSFMLTVCAKDHGTHFEGDVF